MKIDWLINSTYQVLDEDNACLYQGSFEQCFIYILAKRSGLY